VAPVSSISRRNLDILKFAERPTGILPGFQLCGGSQGFLLATIPARDDLQLHGHCQILWQALLLPELNNPISRFRFESIPAFQF